MITEISNIKQDGVVFPTNFVDTVLLVLPTFVEFALPLLKATFTLAYPTPGMLASPNPLPQMLSPLPCYTYRKLQLQFLHFPQ